MVANPFGDARSAPGEPNPRFHAAFSVELPARSGSLTRQADQRTGWPALGPGVWVWWAASRESFVARFTHFLEIGDAPGGDRAAARGTMPATFKAARG